MSSLNCIWVPITLGLISSIVLPAQQKPSELTGSTAQQAKSWVAHPSVYGEENLRSLSLKDSNLRPADPIAGEKDEYPDFTRELLEVQWRDGDPIYLYIIKPHGVTKPPVVLYLYSYPSETDRFRDNE
jgi:hypothetical protein